MLRTKDPLDDPAMLPGIVARVVHDTTTAALLLSPAAWHPQEQLDIPHATVSRPFHRSTTLCFFRSMLRTKDP